MIAIINYGSGNLASVKNAFDFLKVESAIVQNPWDIEKADKIVLPGVGNFGFMMQRMRWNGQERAIKKAIAGGTPYLGICLGLQALFEESEESPGVMGMGVLEGKVVKFAKGKVPQIGWNKIEAKNAGIEDGFAYFVNSYYAKPKDMEVVLGTSDYFGKFTSAVRKGNITAVQFHPEKSAAYGLEFLRRWSQCSQRE